MNLLSEILKFEKLAEYNEEITVSDIRLWNTLMYIAYEIGKVKYGLSNAQLRMKSKLSKHLIEQGRERLKDLGLIDFKVLDGHRTVLYEIKSCDSLFSIKESRHNMYG